MTIPLFDCHCDTAWLLDKTGGDLYKNPYHIDLERFSRYSPRGQFFAIWGGGPVDFDRRYTLLKRQFNENPGTVRLCLTAGDAKKAAEEDRLAAFLSVEGADLLGCTIEGLEKAYDLGVRMVNITWNGANVLSGTNADEAGRGLSPVGREFFLKIEQLGMIADMSHISEKGFFDCAQLAKGPIVASHSNSAKVFPHRRNITDEQFYQIIRLNGVAGINFFSEFLGEDPGIEHIVAHIAHFCALGGEKNICIGSDFDGCDSLPRGINGVHDTEKIYGALLRENYPEDLVRDIFYNNLMRVVDNVLR